MDKKTRLNLAFALEEPDRPPILGGWLAAPETICRLTGCAPDAYWEDPVYWGIEAEKVLGSDGLIDVVQPRERDDYRVIDRSDLERRAGYSIERVLAEIEAMPAREAVKEEFDADRAHADFARDYTRIQKMCGELLWCPADWQIIPHALWYHEFGYETAMLTLNPDVPLENIRTYWYTVTTSSWSS